MTRLGNQIKTDSRRQNKIRKAKIKCHRKKQNIIPSIIFVPFKQADMLVRLPTQTS